MPQSRRVRTRRLISYAIVCSLVTTTIAFKFSSTARRKHHANNAERSVTVGRGCSHRHTPRNAPFSYRRHEDAVADNSVNDQLSLFKEELRQWCRSTLIAVSLAATLVTPQVSLAESNANSVPPTTASTQGAPPAYDETWNLIRKYALDQKFNGQDWDEAYTKYSKGLDSSTTDEDAIMKATTNLVNSMGDKYTRILDKESYERIQKFDLIGVGVTLMPDPSTKEIIVGSPPVKGSAADQNDLRVNDVIVAVNGQETSGKTAFDIIDQMSDDPNAEQVTFSVRRGDEARDVTMKRQFSEVKDPISYRVSEIRGDGLKVGYVRIAEFNSLVKTKLEAALNDLESQGVNAYVLDVRGNPGGAFQSAIEIAGLFLNDALATDVVDGNGVSLKFRTSKDHVIIDASDPVAVWVDGRSASASEVLGGALRDNCRAVVMGERSFGKGLVQAVYGLKNQNGLVLTVARYFTPGGYDINKVGIVPEISKDEALPSAPGFIPVLGSDTSRVDFTDVSNRLSMCSAENSS